MAEINNIFDLMGAPAPSPAEIAGESSFKNVLKNKDGFSPIEEEIKAARAKEASTEETTPVADEKSSDIEVAPELSIVESTEESKVPASVPEAPKKKSKAIQPEKEIVQGIPNDILNSLSVDDIYERLMESDEYYPTVDDIESMSDEELDQAYRYKLISEALTPDRFLFIWFLGGKKVPRSFKEQYMIKAKTFDKGLKYVLDHVTKHTSAHHSTLQKDYCDFLVRDEAMYEAEKAKEEADRKAKAEAARAKAKEKKSKKKTESKPAAPSKANTDDKAKADDKAAEKKEAVKKPSTKKKSTAPKAATDDSVMSLFNMF